MPQQPISLNELVTLFRHMDNPMWVDGRLRGNLVVQNEDMAVKLRSLLAEESADSYPCTIESGDPADLHAGSALTLAFGTPRTAIGLVAGDIDALLRNRDIASGTSDQKWYVAAQDVASWETGNPICVRLSMVRRLVAALETAATLFDQRKYTLIFIQKARLDIPIQYTSAALDKLDLQSAECLIAALETKDGHSAQRNQICATAIFELLNTTSRDERFSHMLSRIGELEERFRDGYSLFASSFSFERVRGEAEAVRVEYTAKIHKTLSDIQGQLLGIPISTIIVATQFKDSSTPGQFWINIAVLAGAFIFFILLSIALWNQKHSLDVISDEVDRHQKALLSESPELAGRLDGIFDRLKSRIIWHQIALCFIASTAAVGLIIGFAAFWMLTH
jgi:hypothetical protein